MAARTTVTTPAVRRQIPRRHVVPIASDQHCITNVTVSSLTGGIVNITGIDVVNTSIYGYLACSLQCLRWCRRDVPPFSVRVEGREMPRHILAGVVHYSGTLSLNFNVLIVLTGDKQGGDLKPDFCLVFKVLKRLEHGGQLARTEFLVENLGEPFEVDIGCVHVSKEFGPGLG